MPPRKRAAAQPKAAKKKPTPRRKSAVPPEDRPLTAKQQSFVDWYYADIVNGNGVQAAIRAGYTGSYNTLCQAASENLRKPNVKKALEKRRAEMSAQADVTVEGTLRKITEIRERALESGQYSAAAKCAEMHAKFLKMLTDRIEHTATLDEVSLEDLVNLFHEITKGGGLDLGKLLARNGPDHGSVSDSAGDPPAD